MEKKEIIRICNGIVCDETETNLDFTSLASRIFYNDYDETLSFEGFQIEKVDSHGGSEGDGEDIWCVVAIKKANEILCYFKFQGEYSSWADTYWDDDISLVTRLEVKCIKWMKN